MSPEQAAIAFLTPRRSTRGVPPNLPGLQALRMRLPAGFLHYWRAGEGPTVLLVHGWEGAPEDLMGFAAPLLEAGRSIAWVELPAHGGSEVSWTSVPHAAHALRRLGDALGELDGVIAHSVGGALTALALAQGLRAERAVLISAPAHYRTYVQGFAHVAGLDPATAQAMQGYLASEFGIEVDAVSTPAAVAKLEIPALLVHSRDDRVVRFEDCEQIALALRDGSMFSVDGLGHRRILGDDRVRRAVCDFILQRQAAEISPGNQ